MVDWILAPSIDLAAAALLAVAFVTAFRLADRWVHYRILNIARASAEVALFRKAACRFIEADSSPDELVEVIHKLAHEAGRPELARWLTKEIRAGRFNEDDADDEAFSALIASLPEESRHDYYLCFTCAVMSSASSGIVRAEHRRNVIRFGFPERSPAQLEPTPAARRASIDYAVNRAPNIEADKRHEDPLELVAA